jgi:hypothetical protein
MMIVIKACMMVMRFLFYSLSVYINIDIAVDGFISVTVVAIITLIILGLFDTFIDSS